MSCCGQTAGRLVVNQKDIDAGLALEIEYSGGRTVTVTGAVTGKSYSFSGLQRLGAVDPRDAMAILRDGRFRLKRVIPPKPENHSNGVAEAHV
jgi:hypothetical protein